MQDSWDPRRWIFKAVRVPCGPGCAGRSRGAERREAGVHMDEDRLERLHKAEEIFLQLVELPTSARPPDLQEACCNDDLLRAEVETMLRLSPEARAWFDVHMKAELSEALTGFSTTRADVGSPTLQEPLSEISEGSVLAHYRI